MIKRFWQKTAAFSFYTPLIALYLLAIPMLSLSRLLLTIWQSDRVIATDFWPQLLLQGIRVDFIQLGLMVLIPIILMPLFAHKKLWSAWKKFTFVWVIFSATLLVFLEAATPGFIAEYGVRPNHLFVEYLKYPHEVMPMLWNGFRVHVFAVIILLAITVYALNKIMRPWLSEAKPSFSKKKSIVFWVLWPLILVLVFISIRSTTVHRPANPAYFAMTSDTMVNNLILNGAWSVFHAVYSLKHERKSSDMYGKMDMPDIMQQVQLTRDMLQDKRPLLNNASIPTLTEQIASIKRDKPLNLVIVLQESLGATFVESLGGVPVTPELEKLKAEGWWFNNLYATGTRSVRGIEAVVTGFLPTPAQSVVKLSGSQDHFFTLASLLHSKGYLNEFIYGGEAHFDNMRTFFINNDFDQVVDEKDYKNPIFVGSWGASDEDLFNKAHAQILDHHNKKQPFFTLIFTSSNHSPFEFPDDRVTLFEQPKATENNAVKYADYAMGQFFKQAKKSPYWKDTLFLIVADHDIRVRDQEMVPIKNFHIPGLILGADIQPKVLNTVASQVDLAPTMISLMGLDGKHPMVGRDLSREPSDLKGRAMMQYEDNFAWLEGDQAVILRPNKSPSHAKYDRPSKVLTVDKADAKPAVDAAAMEKRALAHSLLPAILYRDRAYHLP